MHECVRETKPISFFNFLNTIDLHNNTDDNYLTNSVDQEQRTPFGTILSECVLFGIFQNTLLKYNVPKKE